MKWYIKCLKHYADFSGRARRKEYWMFVLFYIIFAFAWLVLISALSVGFGEEVQSSAIGFAFFSYILALLLPSLAVSVRRLHDTGRSGWWLLLALIPYIGWLVLFIFFVINSEWSSNKYGDNPKGEESNMVVQPDMQIESVKMSMEARVQTDDKDKAPALVNGHPLSDAQPPFSEFAKKNDLSLIVELKKSKMELQISANKCTINWGDNSSADEYYNIKAKNISHRYLSAGSYTITINAVGLSEFNCYYVNANVTAIYLNNCPQLEHLVCYLNKLTSLDISRCTALKSLSCGNNKLTSLDLSNNLALEYLSCEKNLLTCLDISNNMKLRDVNCAHNQLSILNVNHNSAIQCLQCNNNQLSEQELNRIFNQLPVHNSSYRSVNSWYSGTTHMPLVIFACGNNPGFKNCNKKIAQNKKWLVWIEAMYMPATLAGTPGHWTEKRW